MSTLAYSNVPGAHGNRTLRVYAANVLHAAHLLLGALIALKPAQVERRISRRQKRKALMELSAMARDVENSMPGLAAELRYLANHG
jgi:hypothetical protein